jgi:prepilin-type processing-associated H-X9-DG protein
MNWLNPYIGQKRDPQEQLYFNQGDVTIFNCPARPPRRVPGIFGSPSIETRDLGYGYNELGTHWDTPSPQLGLGFTFQVIPGTGQPANQRIYQSPGNTRQPSNMIALGDTAAAGWLTPNAGGQSTLQGIHGENTANTAFCDAHIETAKNEMWCAPNERARARWNSDNLPHPETW